MNTKSIILSRFKQCRTSSCETVMANAELRGGRYSDRPFERSVMSATAFYKMSHLHHIGKNPILNRMV